MEERRKAQGIGSKAIWVISSRSLRSAQARTANGICDKRVPSLASPSLGHYATLSLVVIGRGEIISDFGLRISDCGMRIAKPGTSLKGGSPKDNCGILISLEC
jgi:hypothetical protein